MIRSFRHKGLENFFRKGSKAGQAAHADRLARQLARLEVATVAADMNVPGWKLHALKGGLTGHWAVTVSGNWRMIFAFEDGAPYWLITLTTTESITTEEAIAMTRMYHPPHPGLTLRDDVLPALGLSISAAAAQLGVTRVALSRVVNGQAAISPEMALRIERWLGVEYGGSADLWLAQQSAYDLWQVAQVHRKVLSKIRPASVLR